MVPPPVPTEFLYDLRAVAENVSRDRCVQWEVHPPKATDSEVVVPVGEVEVTNATNSVAVCKPQVAEVADVAPPPGGTRIDSARYELPLSRSSRACVTCI